MSTPLALLLTVILLAGNAFFVGAEFAAMSARRSQLEPLADAGNKRAAIAVDALQHTLAAEHAAVYVYGALGGMTSQASAAALYEVGFNHFFRGKDHPGGGDHVFFQGHASPGMYARAYLEGRLTEQQLDEALDVLSMTHP